ncbi:TetR/AcrR family transcriptional regulator [bacterium]|nr:TetR/AcrR family transcriptional regulator [bacterium]
MAKLATLSKLKEKERETRQKLIIDAARKVFEKKTYDSVSMAEIAKTAGMAKSSIYTYFSSQESLYVEVAYRDSNYFIKELEKKIQLSETHSVETVITHFLDYYILHKAQWRMITHFALHGDTVHESVEKLNEISRKLMDTFDSILKKLDYKGNTRLLAHTLFASLSGILISFRNYPGRTEEERIAHMKRIGEKIKDMMIALIEKDAGTGTSPF